MFRHIFPQPVTLYNEPLEPNVSSLITLSNKHCVGKCKGTHIISNLTRDHRK